VIVFVGIDPAVGPSEQAREAIAHADSVFVDEHAAACVPDATVAPRVRVEQLLERARHGVVARVVAASPVFSEETLAEIAAAIDAPVPVHTLPAPGSLPLSGKRIVVTRASEQAEGMARALRRRGALAVLAPTIAIGPAEDPGPLEQAVRTLERYALVAFTSANGVDAFFRALDGASLDARALRTALVAAIGPGTAASLVRHGVRADVLADEHRGEALAEAVLARVAPGSRVLLPRAAVARNAFPDALAARGVPVDIVEAYRTRPPPEAMVAAALAQLRQTPPDAVAFTASSTVDNFCSLFPEPRELLRGVAVASIGPITSDTCRRLGLEVALESNPYTIPALVAALEAHFARVIGRQSSVVSRQ